MGVYVAANAVNHKFGFGTPSASKGLKKREQEAIATLGVPADGSATAIPAHFAIGKLVSSGAAAAKWDGLLEVAKERARKLGGDAIVITSYGVCPAVQTEYGAIVGDCFAADVVRYGEAPPAP